MTFELLFLSLLSHAIWLSPEKDTAHVFKLSKLPAQAVNLSVQVEVMPRVHTDLHLV